MKKLVLSLLSVMLLSGPAFAAGDAVKGAKVFKKCAACHSPEEGKNKMGPSLFGVVGRDAASIEGYKYSKAMTKADIVWDDENLAHFLKSPRKFVKGTKMSFGGIKKDGDMDNLLAYLDTLK